MKPGFLDKLIQRLDRIDSTQVQHLITHLVQEKGFLESVFEALQEGIMILANDGTVTFLNRAACRFFGLDADKAVGSRLDQLIRGLDWQQIVSPNRCVSRDLEVFYPEHRFLHFDLSPIQPENFDDIGGQVTPLGHVMLVRDETSQRRQTEQEWDNQQLNALTLLAAGVAHEIGNPLNSLGIHLQLLRRKMRKLDALQSASLMTHLETAESEIQRLDTILQQFLHAIRPSLPQRTPANLNMILQESLQVLEPTLTDRHIRVELDLDESLPLLAVDENQLKQVFFNLLKNAYEALSGDVPTIQLSTRGTEQEVIISIRDNGSGISPEQMGALFEPYQSTKKSGTGLGLLIVRRIIREHGGEFKLESEPGLGTTVTLYLPLLERKVRLLNMAESAASYIDLDPEHH